MGQAFLNSLFIAIPATLLPLLVCSLAAYAFSWINFRFRDTIFLIIIALMMIPVQVAFLPVLQLFKPFGLTQGFVGIWLAHTAFALPFGIFLLRNFFITLPRDLIEAARIDGSSTFGVFWTIVVPLVGAGDRGLRDLPVPVGLERPADGPDLRRHERELPDDGPGHDAARDYGAEWHLLAASAFLLMAVPLLVFFSLQRYFVQGLLAGSVK